ncbi:MAG: hypothetical protein R3B72_19195 [Polyangiaceae bacterium]
MEGDLRLQLDAGGGGGGESKRAVDGGDRLWEEMGLVPDARDYDFAHQRRMILALYEPWLLDGHRRLREEDVAELWRLFVLDNPNKFRSRLPREWFFVNRLQWGVYAILAKLEAEASWRDHILPLLYDDPSDYPPPYTAAELQR